MRERKEKERVLALISVPSVCVLHITISIFHFQISLLRLWQSGEECFTFNGFSWKGYTVLHWMFAQDSSFHIPSNNIIVYRRSSFVILMGYSIIPLIYFFFSFHSPRGFSLGKMLFLYFHPRFQKLILLFFCYCCNNGFWNCIASLVGMWVMVIETHSLLWNEQHLRFFWLSWSKIVC